jgi:hypothetical protein
MEIKEIQRHKSIKYSFSFIQSLMLQVIQGYNGLISHV